MKTFAFIFFIVYEAMKIREVKTGRFNPICTVFSSTLIDILYYVFLISNLFSANYKMIICSIIILLMGLFSSKTKSTKKAIFWDSVITIILLIIPLM